MAGLDGSGDVGGEFRVGEELVDECGEDVLAGDSGEAELVGCFALPDVECAVLRGCEVDGAPDAFLPDGRGGFLWGPRGRWPARRVGGSRGAVAESFGVGLDAVCCGSHGTNLSESVFQDVSISVDVRSSATMSPYAVPAAFLMGRP